MASDLLANHGTLFVGTSYDTPEFAVDCVQKWWRTEGQHRYPDADRLGILTVAGATGQPVEHGSSDFNIGSAIVTDSL